MNGDKMYAMLQATTESVIEIAQNLDCNGCACRTANETHIESLDEPKYMICTILYILNHTYFLKIEMSAMRTAMEEDPTIHP